MKDIKLSEIDILVEDWGGKYQSQEISAKSGVNIDDLLEKVLLEAEPIEILGETSVEKVKVHDLNEDEEYELFADAIILP